MSRFSDNLQMYWAPLVGTALFVPEAWHYYSLGQWEDNIEWAAIALAGFIGAVAPEEVSSWSGQYRWTRKDFWTYPATYIQFFGFTAQVYVLWFWVLSS